jgi:hypothetical protein
MMVWAFTNAEIVISDSYKVVSELSHSNNSGTAPKNSGYPLKIPKNEYETDEENETNENFDKLIVYSKKENVFTSQAYISIGKNFSYRKLFLSSGSVRGPPGLII